MSDAIRGGHGTFTPQPATLRSASRRPGAVLGVGYRAGVFWGSLTLWLVAKREMPFLPVFWFYLPTGQCRPPREPGAQLVFRGRMQGSWMLPSPRPEHSWCCALDIR